MNRDEARKILGEGATEEQITNLLNNYHIQNSEKVKELERQLKELTDASSKYSDYDEIKSKLENIEKANMTEQERLEEQKKEIAKNLSESKLIVNKAKAKEILAGEDIDEDILSSLVSDDLNATIDRANKMKTTLSNLKDTIAKKTKEELINVDLKPSISNVNQGELDKMTFEKFRTMSVDEQNKFAEEHPEEFENL